MGRKQVGLPYKMSLRSFSFSVSALRASPLARNQEEVVLIGLCLHSLSDYKHSIVSSGRA